MRKLYVCLLALAAVILSPDTVIAQEPEHSFGPAPVQQRASGSGIQTMLPDVANPASRGFVYHGGPGTFQLAKQTLANTTLTAIGAPVPFVFPGAAAWRTTTNQLYVIDQGAPFALYTVDTLTGARTFVANCTGVPHANFTGMTWDYSTNTMYGVSSSLAASQIFTINLTTGVCTPIGAPTAISPGCIMLNAAPGGSLFGVDLVNDQLFRWNKTTGVPTSIGPIGFNANFGQDGHFDLSDGQYYYAAYNATVGQPQLRVIDTLTGSSVLTGAYATLQVQTLGIYTLLNPVNDDCANSILLNCGQTVTGSTATATLDGPASCVGGGTAPDVWYRVVGTGANITAILCGSGYDTKVDVYTGTCGALVCVGGNDDFCGFQSQFTWATTTGTTYHIRVHGFLGSTGPFTLNIACQPVNDNCSGAININCGQSLTGTTVGGAIDAVPFCGFAVSSPGVWYTFIGSGGIESVNTCTAASFDTRIDVFSGTCGALVSVGCNDDDCGLRSQVTFGTTAGTRYYVLVHGFGAATGTFTLTRTCPPCVGVPSPGAITGSSGPYCPGTSVTLTLAGNTIANGITYQWRSSLTPGGPYTAIPGATNVSYTFNTTVTTYFIVSVTCTNPGGGTGNTVEFPVLVNNLVHSNVLATPPVSCSPGATVISATVSGSVSPGNYTHSLSGPGVIAPPVVSGLNNSNVSFSVTGIPAGVQNYTLSSGIALNPNYSFTTSTGNALVPGATLVAGSQGDDVTASLPLPFPYSVYGVTYNSAFVSSNGNIQFTGAGNASFTNTCPLPTATFNAQGGVLFMPHWDDLWTAQAGGGIYTSVSGVAPNRILNIEWRAQYFPGTGTVNFVVRLYEGQERADFIYGTITGTPGSSATVGVQGGPTPTTLFTQYSCNSAALNAGLGISFVRPVCTVTSNVTVTVNQTPIITLTTVPPAPIGSNYTFTTSAGNAIVPGTTLVPGSQGDDLTVAVPLPFTYFAYGTGYNSVRVGSNGNLQFTGGGNTAFTNTCPLPSATFNAQGGVVFMPHWDDLWTAQAGEGIFTSVSGVAPNRIFNIEWRASYFPGTGSVSLEARLFEGQQRVDFIYGTITGSPGASASIGVQGAPTPTTLFTQYSCNTASLSPGLGISFTLPSLIICNGTIVRMDAQAVPGALQTFNTGATNIHIPTGGTTNGNASPYPGTIAVSGLVNTGVTVKSVTLTGFSHDLPDDVDIVLVSPSGQSVILMSDAGGSTAVTGRNYTFDDAAANPLADATTNLSGTYQPTNYGAGDTWPAPGPGGTPVSTTLSTFTGNANGNWNLYIVDDAAGSVGFLADWRITFSVPQRVVFSPLTNLFTDPPATIPYTGTPEYTVWARPTVFTTYTVTSTIAGCTNSASVNITVNNPPVITTQPAAPAAPVCPGFNTTFTVVATGTSLTYQWQRSTDNGVTWTNVAEDVLHSGTTTPSITVNNPTVAQNGHRYRVIISGVCPPTPVTSNVVILVVATPPVITTQPANRTVCAPDAAVFTVVAGGVPAPNIYQWQVSTTGAAGPWVNLTTGGSYTPTLTVSPTATSQSGSLYRVIVTNNCGQSVTSSNALLTVNAPTPVVITPLPTRICLSDTLVNLSATPVGGSWSGIGVSGFNFIPSATSVGTYTLTYTYVNAAGCTSTGTVTAPVIDCPERIRLLRNDGVILFPNPNGGRFNIRMNSVLYNYLGMRVYNTAGQLLMTQVFNGLVYGRVVPIDLSHLPAGTYMVKFFYDDGIRTSEKTFPVIIQRN
ncbi:MAG: T9SS type A sorting domain-containing protein [Bacteroidota bacterium]